MYRRAAVSLVGLLLAIAGPTATSVAPVAAADSTPSAAGTTSLTKLTKLRIVDHNIEHDGAALASAVRRAERTHAEAITLQEICWWQAASLQRRHPGWTVVFKADADSGWCTRKAPGLAGSLFGQVRREIGLAAVWTGGGRGLSSVLTFVHQLDPQRSQGLACVTWTAGAARRVCSVHLLSSDTRQRRLIRTRQAREVHRATARWVARDELVVLAGDFNSQPDRVALDYIYRFRGRGSFREATSCTPRRDRDCRATRTTFDGGRTKIDYLFFSANRMSPTAARHLSITPTRSDHHLLSGWAYVDASAR